MKKVIAFDLDGTLAASKQPVPKSVGKLLNILSRKYKILIISGGPWKQFKNQFLNHIQLELPEQFILMPTSGSTMYRHNGLFWMKIYHEKIPLLERFRIKRTIKNAMNLYHDFDLTIYGKIIEDRKSQITYSACGQLAPPSLKDEWIRDRANQKRKSDMALLLKIMLPEYEVRLGGTTSIDITKKGIDKAYGVLKYLTYTGFKHSEVLFIGDRLDQNGNDYPVYEIGIDCVRTTGPIRTLEIIDKLIKNEGIDTTYK